MAARDRIAQKPGDHSVAEAFFFETEASRERLSDLFDFVWPTAAALWNLRWQVQGFLKEVPNATKAQLENRFTFGSHLSSTDLRISCVHRSWDEQKEIFAGFILSNAIATYEFWADALMKELGAPAQDSKKLQFPDRPGKPGIQSFVAQQTSAKSVPLDIELYPRYAAKKKYDWPRVQNLALCFRYFKEIRNSIMHGGGIATQVAAVAYANFLPVSDRHSLGMRANIEIFPVIEGQPVKLSLRSVVGFSDVLIRLMHSIDAELMRGKPAEATLKRRLMNRSYPMMLSSDARRRHHQICLRCATSGLSKPAKSDELYKYMVAEGLISF